MKLKKIAFALAACGLALGFSSAQAQKLSGDKIVIGFITDMSSLYSDIDGTGGVEAIRMAIADMEKQFPGKKIELVYADHQNKADIASSKVREWIDQSGADVIIGGTNSATALATAKVAAEKKRPYIAIGAASSRLTNEDCTPYHGPLRIRHRGAGQRHRFGGGEERRQELVLPDCGLRVWALAGEGHQ